MQSMLGAKVIAKSGSGSVSNTAKEKQVPAKTQRRKGIRKERTSLAVTTTTIQVHELS
jgi:hypothetical protein